MTLQTLSSWFINLMVLGTALYVGFQYHFWLPFVGGMLGLAIGTIISKVDFRKGHE